MLVHVSCTFVVFVFLHLRLSSSYNSHHEGTINSRKVFFFPQLARQHEIDGMCKNRLGDDFKEYLPSTNKDVEAVIDLVNELGWNNEDVWITSNVDTEKDIMEAFSWKLGTVDVGLWFRGEINSGNGERIEPSAEGGCTYLTSKIRNLNSITGKAMLASKACTRKSYLLCTVNSNQPTTGVIITTSLPTTTRTTTPTSPPTTTITTTSLSTTSQTTKPASPPTTATLRTSKTTQTITLPTTTIKPDFTTLIKLMVPELVEGNNGEINTSNTVLTTFVNPSTELATLNSITTTHSKSSEQSKPTIEDSTTVSTTEHRKETNTPTARLNVSTTGESTQIITHRPNTQRLYVPVLVCPCECPNKTIYTNVSSSDLQKLTETIQANLTVEKNRLSSTVRKKTSAKDHRPSCVTGGVVAAVFLAFTFGSLILLDTVGCITI